MRVLKSEKCRVCNRTFCCTSCRAAHETSKHNFFTECDICKYGQIVLSSTCSKELLDHLKSSHFPLRCDLCKKTFNIIDDVFPHVKCPEANKIQTKDEGKSPKTPIQVVSFDENFDSPPLTNILVGKNALENKNINVMISLATSTPMHHGGGNLEKVKEVIVTPVESTENTKNSILKNPNSRCNSYKRVTFSGTPFIESSHRKSKNMVMAGAPVGDSHPSRNVTNSAISNLVISPSTFYSAKNDQLTNLHSSSVLVKSSEMIVEESRTNPDPNNSDDKPKVDLDISCEHEDNTVWISALNISVEICSDEDDHKENVDHKKEDGKENGQHDKDKGDENDNSKHEDELKDTPNTNSVTPTTPSVTNRKINIVKPTSVKKERKEQLFVDMVQTFSTPNVARTIQPSAYAMFTSNGDLNPPVSNIYVENTTSAVSFINSNSDATTPNEVIAEVSAPAVLRFEDSEANTGETYDVDCMTSDTSISKGNTFWTSVSNIVSNIFHNFSGVDASCEDRANRSMKRCSSDNDLLEPLRKKYKFTDIKCRRPIRDLPPLEISNDLQISIRVNVTEGTKKIYVDKATITDESIFANL